MTTAPPRGPTPGRWLGLYALSVMEREGPLYGYQLSARIADRTAGGWRPGAGAVYPALGGLVRRGLAVRSRRGRRQVYRITGTGRQLLLSFRRRQAWRRQHAPEFGLLWAELAGEGDPGRFLIDRIGSLSTRFLDYLASDQATQVQRRRHARRLIRELRASERRIHAWVEATPDRRGS